MFHLVETINTDASHTRHYMLLLLTKLLNKKITLAKVVKTFEDAKRALANIAKIIHIAMNKC